MLWSPKNAATIPPAAAPHCHRARDRLNDEGQCMGGRFHIYLPVTFDNRRGTYYERHVIRLNLIEPHKTSPYPTKLIT